MNTSRSKSIAKLQKILEFDSSLKELEIEAEILFSLLDKHSESIRKFEEQLNGLRANFEFQLCVDKKESTIKEAKEHHKHEYPHVAGYHNKVCWYFSWELDETSKKYRLFLISIEEEIVGYYCPPFYEHINTTTFTSQCTFKKPLIETKLSIRFQYLEHLIPFINAFKERLASCRLSIEAGNLSF